MPKIIDHEQRRISILKMSVRLFAKDGVQNTSLSRLAKDCGISRPTLYLYFRDKEEILNYALKYYTDKMFADYRGSTSLGEPILPQIRRILADIIFRSWYSRNFVICLGDFIVQKKRLDLDFADAIHRRTVKLEHLLRRMLRDGIAHDEIRIIPVNATAIQLLDFVQAYLFKLAILHSGDPGETVLVIESFLEGLRVNLRRY